jgi:hypothetical protein
MGESRSTKPEVIISNNFKIYFLGIAECRDESPISTLVAKGVCKTPLPENHIHNQHCHEVYSPPLSGKEFGFERMLEKDRKELHYDVN